MAATSMPGSAVRGRIIDAAWLARAREEILEPELPIVDAHHHLWRRPDGAYLWPDYLADATGHRVEATLFVECTASYRDHGDETQRPVGETVFAVAQGREAAVAGHAIAAGIVGYADLGLGAAVEPVLHAHLAAAGSRFKGVRNSASWHADEQLRMQLRPPKRAIEAGMLSQPALREAVALLGRLGLSFDVWLYHTQLDELAALARACPDTAIIVNHLGGVLGVGPYAGHPGQALDEWRGALAGVAGCSNIVVKFGGLGMRVFGLSQGVEEADQPASSAALASAWRPYFEVCMEAFGPSRCMFESNFPMDKGAMSYATLWNAFKRLTAHWPAAERDALFRGTATRVYRLFPPSHAEARTDHVV